MKHRLSRPDSCILSAGIILVLVLSCAFPCANAAELSADEILEKSRAAMAPPLQYRMRSSGIDAIVYEKLLAGDVLATRFEVSLPIKKINVIRGDQSFEIFPTLGLVIDTTFMTPALKGASGLISTATKPEASNVVALKGIVMRDGKECFEIEIRRSTKRKPQGISETAIAKLPAGQRLFIDRTSYRIVAMEIIASSGSSVRDIELADLEPKADISDDLFLPPQTSDIEHPKSIKEYVALIASAIDPGPLAPLPPPTVSVPQVSKPRRRPLESARIDAQTGRVIIPVPPGMTSDEFERLRAKYQEERLAARRKESAGTAGMSLQRKIGISISLIAVVSILSVILLRRLPAARSK